MWEKLASARLRFNLNAAPCQTTHREKWRNGGLELALHKCPLQ